MNDADVLDSIVNILASSPITFTAYKLFANADVNVTFDFFGVPLKDATDPDAAFNDCGDPLPNPLAAADADINVGSI